MADFTAIDNSLFDQFTAASILAGKIDDPVKPLAYNYCDDCDVAMELHDSEYHCPLCGIIMEYLEDAVVDHGESTAGNIRISTGAHRGRYYNVSADYSKSQLRLIKIQLSKLASAYTGPAIPASILNSAAEAYNRIQQTVVTDDNGTSRKFVRRGNIKDEVLAAFIYYECIRAGNSRKSRDIAAFMRLQTNGFSRGDDIYRTVSRENGVDIPAEIEPMADFIERYCEALNLADSYKGFIRELVSLSETKRIGMNSNVSSKVVGAIYILITNLNLPISVADLEAATDNTKKSTFTKFINSVRANINVFRPVYKRWGVPTMVLSGASTY